MKRNREIFAALIVLLVGLPLVFVYARAVADGSVRHRETPLRAIFGDETFEALEAGESLPTHYLGDDRLAPDFTLRDQAGEPWTLSEHRGEVVVLNFWSVSCRPCLQELPTLEVLANVAERWGDVQVVGVTVDESWEAVTPSLETVASMTPTRARMRHLLDSDRSVVAGLYGTQLYPETWVIDREGVIRLRYDGALDWSSPLVMEIIDSFR